MASGVLPLRIGSNDPAWSCCPRLADIALMFGYNPEPSTLRSVMIKRARISSPVHDERLSTRRWFRQSRSRKPFRAAARSLALRSAASAWHPFSRLILSVVLTGAGFAALADAPQVLAQAAVTNRPAGPAVVPGFWDPRRRPERPDLARLTAVRFMTEVDYPPFNFAGPDGNPAGFNVDLARMVCEELKVTCTVQMRRFDTLLDSLDQNRGDAAIASIAVSEQTRRRADFSDPYYRPSARFVTRRDTSIDACARSSPRRMCEAFRIPRRRAKRCGGARWIFCSATALRCRSGLMARVPAAAASLRVGRLLKAVISAKVSGSQSSAAIARCV